MFCHKKIFKFALFATTCLVLGLGGWIFAEHFYVQGRYSFFCFDLDFLRSFYPWRIRPDMFPGEAKGAPLSILTASFVFQFFRVGSSFLFVLIIIGVWFSSILTLSTKKIWTNCLTLLTTPIWSLLFLFFAISPKFPTYFVYSILWAGVFFYLVSLIKKPFGSLIIAGLVGCCAVWLIGFVATIVFWVFYSLFFFIHFRPHLSRLHLFFFFTIVITLQPLIIGKVHAINTFQIYRSGFAKKWYKNGFHKEWNLFIRVNKTDRLITEKRYQEALEIANFYWFSHPCPYEDLISGKNSLFKKFSPEHLVLRQRLAIYTKLALIGSHRLNEDFFNYYRIPEIYNDLSDHNTPIISTIKVFYDRLMGNFTGVYSWAMNLMELFGIDYFLLNESIQAALICEQYNLADKYIRLQANTLFYRKQALIHYKTMTVLQQSNSTENKEREIQQEVEWINEKRKLGLTTWMDETGDIYKEAVVLWSQNPSCLENLEYISLFDLLYKRLDSTVRNIEKYVELSKQTPPYRFPKAWQEMLFIMMKEKPNQIPSSILPFIEQMTWDETILKQCRLFYRDLEIYAKGKLTPVDLTKRFGHTFIYNYYFRFLLETNSSLPKNPPILSH